MKIGPQPTLVNVTLLNCCFAKAAICRWEGEYSFTVPTKRPGLEAWQLVVSLVCRKRSAGQREQGTCQRCQKGRFASCVAWVLVNAMSSN